MRTLIRSVSTVVAGVAALACSAFLATPAGGQEEPAALQITAVNMTALAEGRAAAEGAEAPISRPGDVVEYRLRFTNITNAVIRNVVFDDAIPPGLTYVEASAGADREDVVVEFSIDGGTTYGLRPEVEVQEAGRTVRRPAPPESFTHIRWTVAGTAARGEEIRAHFQARITSSMERPH